MNNLKVQSNRSLQFNLDAIEHDNFTPLSVQFETSVLNLFGTGATFRIDWELSNGSNYFMGTYALVEKLEVKIPNNVFAISGVLYVQVRISDDEGMIWHSEKKHVYVNDSIESETPATIDDKIYVEVPAEFVEGNITSYNPASGRLIDVGESVADILEVMESETTRKSNENNRIENEGDATSGRIGNEIIRENNEGARKSNELDRIASEKARAVYEEFIPDKEYLKGNKTYYLGSSYIAKEDTNGELPTDSTKWQIISKQGDIPDHEWNGTELRFEKPDGTWGSYVDLQGYALPDSWQGVRTAVRLGLGPKIFKIGDQLMANYNGSPRILDVIGINHDGANSLTLQFHDTIGTAKFSEPQALYYAELGLASGNYYFTYLGVSYQFTLTSAVPAKGQLTFPWAYNTEILTAKISSYISASSISKIEEVAITIGATGTALTPINDISRCRYGSNNYKESNVRQWLNSDTSSFAFEPQTNYDRIVNAAPYTGAGFLKLLDPELVAVLGKVDKQVARNTVTDSGGQDTFSDKIFLLSRKEVYGTDEGTVTSESPYEYYSAMAPAAIDTAVDWRIKYSGGSAQYWWLRSPHVTSSCSVRYVYPAGTIYSYYASDTLGVAPACVII